jgi:pimeloyl-ACP methyl ester carboxylesterase
VSTFRSLIVASVAAVAALAAAAPAAASAVPLPRDDPFYAIPAGIAGLPNGAILKSRAVNVSALAVPLPVKAWELEYKSLDNHNGPTAMVTTVMVPMTRWAGGGQRPLVSYQVAEDGADSKCAASYALHAGLASLRTESNASTETALIALALARGWAVAASDYEGPDSHFLAAPEEAHGVLDGIRAALAFAPAGFSAGTPVGLWGYSGGGYATSVAALLQPDYAPELHLAGAAIGSPTASVRAEVTAFSGSIAGGAIAMAIAALDRAYPEQRLEQYLNAAGRAAIGASAHDCLVGAAARFPFARVQDWEASPDAIDLPPMTRFLDSISPEFMPGHPAIPVLLYHDRTDEFAPIAPALDMAARWCAAGTPVQVHIEPVGEHIAYETLGAPRAMAYLAQRFAGRPPPTDRCPDADGALWGQPSAVRPFGRDAKGAPAYQGVGRASASASAGTG